MKKILATILSLAMVLTCASFPAFAAEAETLKPIGVTSTFAAASSYQPVSGIIDGTITTGNYTYFKGASIGTSGDGTSVLGNFIFEFDTPVNLTEIYFQMGANNHILKGAVYGSNDNSTWTPIHQLGADADLTWATAPNNVGKVNTQTISHEGYYKYIKVDVTKTLGTFLTWVEATFTGTVQAVAGAPVKIEPVGASSHLPNHSNYGPISVVIDGSEAGNSNFFRSSTYTTSTGTPGDSRNFSFVVDLGGSYIIAKFYSSWGVNYAKGIALWGSADGVDFGTEPFATVSLTNTSGMVEIDCDASYRYIKVDAYSILNNNNNPACKEVTFYGYDSASVQMVEYTVNYVDAEGEPLADAKTASGVVGATVTETAVEVKGYTPDEETKSITLVDGTNTITFTYTEGVVVKPVSLVPSTVTTTFEAESSYQPVSGIIDGVFTTGNYTYFRGKNIGTAGDGTTVLGNFIFAYEKPVKLTEIYFQMGANNHILKGTIYGSNDLGTWTPIHQLGADADLTWTTASNNVGKTNTQTISHEGYYKYFKVDVTKASGNWLVWVESTFMGVEKVEEIESLGASIRLEENGLSAGLRFAAKVNKALAGIDGTYTYSDNAEIKFGMYLLPKEMLGEHLTLTAYLANGVQDALDVPAKNILAQDDDIIQYTAVLTDIPTSARLQEIIAVPYMVKNGNYAYYNELTRSYSGVAGTALATTYNPNTITAMADSPEKTALREISYKLQYIQRGYDKPYTEQGERILAKLKRGINMQGLDASSWSSWDSHIRTVTSSSSYQNIKNAGFDHVRIPVDFRNAADSNGNLNTSKMTTYVDKAVDAAIGQGLVVLLDFHGWANIMLEDFDYFVTVWTNLATYYKDKYPEDLIFELVNEPHTAEESDGDGGDLNLTNLVTLQTRAVDAIRAIDPDRFICLATSGWNGIWTLKDKDIGSASMFRNTPLMNYQDTIVALHSYTPGEFTHQDMSWAGTGGQTYSWSDNQEAYEAAIKEELGYLVEFVEETGMHAILNEFGCNTGSSVSDADEAAYAKTVVSCIKDNDKIAYTWWEYEQSFGMTSNGSWKTHILNEVMAE